MAHIAFSVFVLLLLASPAAAQSTNKWGAVAYGAPDRAWGAAVDYSSPDEARAAALESCRGRCSQTRVFYMSCAAIAENPAGGIGVEIHSWLGLAINFAMMDCRLTGPECALTGWACARH